MKIKFITTGGTIDKIYFDAKSQYEVGPPQIGEILRDVHVQFEFSVDSILNKDSLDMTDDDRLLIRSAIEAETCPRIVLTHGTDTMRTNTKSLIRLAIAMLTLTACQS